MIYHSISRLGAFVRLAPWLLVVAGLVALVSVPTSLGVQALLGIAAIGGVLALRPLAETRLARVALLGLASIVVLRYWFWRAFETLPGLDDPASFAAAIALFSVETYLIGVFFLSTIVVADPVDHRRPKPVRVQDLPTVDVLIPSYNEPTELLAVTLAAARNMAYPADRLTVVLCDDGGTDERCNHSDPAISGPARARRAELQALCQTLGVVYRTRSKNRGAKAGNLTEAMARLDGELVVIFDADHSPARDFLARTVGYFAEDPKLALVQTPHFFLNKDPIARNLKLDDSTPPENEMFYGLLQRGLDRWGGAFFCGSAAVLRRRALDEVGGISGSTITEDAETSMLIHARGWRSIFVNHAMVAGLQPETFASFLQQRGRWATGMLQLLVLRNPLLMRGLSAWQRLCYLNSMSYWLFPVVRLVLLLAPLLYLFFGLELVVTSASEAVAYAGSYLVTAYVVQNVLFSKVRSPFLSEIYEIAQAPYLARGVFRAIFRPRGATFKVTSKDESITTTMLSEVRRPLQVLFLLMMAGIAALVWRWFAFPSDRDVLQIVGGWAIFNAVLVAASLRALVEQQQRRVAPRVYTVSAPAVAELVDDGGDFVDVPCVIRDVSYSGIGLSIPPRGVADDMRIPEAGDRIRVMLALDDSQEAGPVQCRITSSSTVDGRVVLGATFEGRQERDAYLAIASVLNGDSRRWQAMRDGQTARRRGLVPGMVHAVRLAAAGLYHWTMASLTLSRPEAEAAQPVEVANGWSTETPVELQAFIAARSGEAFRRVRKRAEEAAQAASGDFALIDRGAPA